MKEPEKKTVYIDKDGETHDTREDALRWSFHIELGEACGGVLSSGNIFRNRKKVTTLLAELDELLEPEVERRWQELPGGGQIGFFPNHNTNTKLYLELQRPSVEAVLAFFTEEGLRQLKAEGHTTMLVDSENGVLVPRCADEAMLAGGILFLYRGGSLLAKKAELTEAQVDELLAYAS